MSTDVIEGFDWTVSQLRVLWRRMRGQMLDRHPDVEPIWLFPPEVFPGAQILEFLPVVRHDGPPMLAFREKVK